MNKEKTDQNAMSVFPFSFFLPNRFLTVDSVCEVGLIATLPAKQERKKNIWEKLCAMHVNSLKI